MDTTGTLCGERFSAQTLSGSLIERFLAQTARRPESVAVWTPSQRVTYRRLERWTATLAHRVIEHDGEPCRRPVAVLASHGPASIAGVLGVLRAGRPYVALDRHHPVALQSEMLDDAEVTCLLTDCENHDRGRALSPTLLPLEPSESHEPAPGPSIGADDLACIVYTSGSTGRPKGALETHRNILNNLRNYSNTLKISCEDRLTMLHPTSFGASRLDLFGAVLNGATLCPFDVRDRGTAPLSAWLRDARISIYHASPTVLRQHVLTMFGDESFPDLRLLHLGSEPVTAREHALYREHFAGGGSCQLVNRYGATETGTLRLFVTDADRALDDARVPVGFAVENMDVQVVDPQGFPAAVDEEGEIIVRSEYLSPGYWKRPAETAATFQPDPTNPQARVYRTGDRGVLRADGCLVHFGRGDAQVKVRGTRVELAAVERALLERDGIADAVVLKVDDQHGDAKLHAYVVAREPAPDPRALRAELRERLTPQEMPSTLIYLDALPLTDNGKLDRRALAALAPADRDTQERTPQERTTEPDKGPALEVLRIWREHFGVERLAPDEDFFALGGDSLLALRILSDIAACFERQVTMNDLVEHPTVAQLATFLSGPQPAEEEP